MKKSLLLFSLILCLGCSNQPQSSENGVNIVNFYLNYEQNGLYTSQVVKQDQLLIDPGTPYRYDYVFTGWYLDADNTKPYESGFNIEVNQSFDLYAGWELYDDLDDQNKVYHMLNKLDSLTGKVTKAYVNQTTKKQYAVAEGEFSFYCEKDYNRYEDITTCDYYDDQKNLLAKQQYFYDDELFYNIFDDVINNGEESSKQTAKFNSAKIDNFLNIDFVNMYCYQIKNLYDRMVNDDLATCEYELDFNPTHISPATNEYAFKFNYYSETQSPTMGTVGYYYLYEFAITIVNSKIKRSLVKDTFLMAIEGELQYMDEISAETEYTISNSYPAFTGERFNPDNYLEAQD